MSRGESLECLRSLPVVFQAGPAIGFSKEGLIGLGKVPDDGHLFEECGGFLIFFLLQQCLGTTHADFVGQWMIRLLLQECREPVDSLHEITAFFQGHTEGVERVGEQYRTGILFHQLFVTCQSSRQILSQILSFATIEQCLIFATRRGKIRKILREGLRRTGQLIRLVLGFGLP